MIEIAVEDEDGSKFQKTSSAVSAVGKPYSNSSLLSAEHDCMCLLNSFGGSPRTSLPCRSIGTAP
jgi:hypothetical protein